MKYEVEVNEIMGGTKIVIPTEHGNLEAFAAQPHQVPQRVKDLFEVLYPKKSK